MISVDMWYKERTVNFKTRHKFNGVYFCDTNCTYWLHVIDRVTEKCIGDITSNDSIELDYYVKEHGEEIRWG